MRNKKHKWTFLCERIPILNKVRKFYHQIQHYQIEQRESKVRLYNYVNPPAMQDFWLRDFIEVRNLLDNSKKTISVFSVFGSKLMIRLNRGDVKILVARENLHRSNWKEYDNLALDLECIDLCLGFDYKNPDKRYMRFPLWIMWIFPPTVTYNDICDWCQKVNNPNNKGFQDKKFCSFICSHDDTGRRSIYNQLSSIGGIDCPGKYLHNCDDLQNLFCDNKIEYLKGYRFNLTPENSDTDGYCTEKLFEAISAGCIPIYTGSGNNPEPDILNHDAICFIRMYDEMPMDANKEVIENIKQLNNSKEEYIKFASQPRLKPEAADIIWNYIQELEKRIKEVIDK